METIRRFRLTRPRTSVRSQLIIWNIIALSLLFIFLGFVVHYAASNTLLNQVDHELTMSRPGPPGGQPPPGMGSSPGHEPRGFFGHNDEGSPDGPPPQENDNPSQPPRMFQSDQFNDNWRRQPRAFMPDGSPMFFDQNEGPWDALALKQVKVGQNLFSTISVGGVPTRILTRSILRDGTIFSIEQVPYPLSEVNSAISGLDRALLALIPVGLFAAGLAGALLTDRVLRPVRQLIITASETGVENLNNQLPVAGDDEFAELARTFNGMLDRLRLSFDEQKRLVNRLNALVNQQRRFTADASHELKTPLTVILANTGLAKSGHMSTTDYADSISDIHRSAEAMSELVQNLLVLAQADEGRLGQDRSIVLIDDLFEDAIVAISCSASSIPKIVIKRSGISVHCNRGQMTRVISNLLENAVRSIHVQGDIFLQSEQDTTFVKMVVTDTGEGIAAEHLPHLGERFFRIDTSRSRGMGGTGLGLSICRSIVEAHQGTIKFESQLSMGTTVTISLPAAMSDELSACGQS